MSSDETSTWPFPSGWKEQSIEQAMSSIIDYRGKTPVKSAFGIPLITAKVVKAGRILEPSEFILPEAYDAWMTRGLPKGGDVVITTEAPLGEVAQLDRRKVALAQRLILLRGKPKVLDNTFLKFLLQSEYVREQILARGTGTTVIGIRQSELREVRLPLPPLPEQRAIARILGALDDKIELNRKMNRTLEELAQALFRSWFVDFDPVVAKSEGRKPYGMDEATAALFPSEFQDSELGRIPRGWGVKALKTVVNAVYDGPHATPPDATEGAVFLGIKNLTGTGLDLSEIKHISESDWPRWTKRVTPSAGDIVFSYEAAIGRFAVVPPNLRCCLGRRLALVRTKSTSDTYYLFHTFVSAAFQEMLVSRSNSGSTVDRIPLEDFPGYMVLWPNVMVREAFGNQAVRLWRQLHTNQTQSEYLVRTRDTLLPKLLSGEIRLKQAEQIVEKAL